MFTFFFQIQKQFRHLPKNDRDNRDNDISSILEVPWRVTDYHITVFISNPAGAAADLKQLHNRGYSTDQSWSTSKYQNQNQSNGFEVATSLTLNSPISY